MNKRPDQLSGGQRQRVAVARALANEPPIILADEPTGSLDSKASEQVFEVLRDLVDKHGKTVVAVTHDLGLAERMDRQIELLDGRHRQRQDSVKGRPLAALRIRRLRQQDRPADIDAVDRRAGSAAGTAAAPRHRRQSS